MCVPELLRRRRIIRNPTPPASTAATAIAAAPAVVMTDLLDPAKPTRTMPVLVTGPLPADVAPGVADIVFMPDALAPMPMPALALIPPPRIEEGDGAGAWV